MCSLFMAVVMAPARKRRGVVEALREPPTEISDRRGPPAAQLAAAEVTGDVPVPARAVGGVSSSSDQPGHDGPAQLDNQHRGAIFTYHATGTPVFFHYRR